MLTLNLDGMIISGLPSTPVVVDIYLKKYYDTDYTLIGDNITLGSDGSITGVSAPVDPAFNYIVKVENLLCGFEYLQVININPYCDLGYTLSGDKSFCFRDDVIASTPPTSPEVAVKKNGNAYTTCGTYIYGTGYAVNGTGITTQIPLSNPFWKNGGTCVDNNTVDGPLNRSGIWATTTLGSQQVGFSVCLDVVENEKTVYIGIACDNYGEIRVDGDTILLQNEAALAAQYGGLGGVCFKVWHVYPVTLRQGNRIIEILGTNTGSIAALGCEIYDNTLAQISAATNYDSTGLNLLFSSKDYVGMEIQLGSNGLGYSCPVDYALNYCSDPIVCRRTQITPVRYSA